MATASLPPGLPVTMLQNVAYACPGKLSYLFSSTAGAAFESSNTQDFATSVALGIFEGYVFLSGQFVRSTAGNALAVAKVYF